MTETKQTKSLVERLAEKRDRASKAKAEPTAGKNGFEGAHKTLGALTPATDDQAFRASKVKSKHVAKLDLRRLRSRGFVTPDGGRSKIVEEFRAIKRPLLRRALEDSSGGRSHVIMVTSSKPGEGKTFSSVNLAMSIASERGLNVLLVDGDVIKADLPDVLGFKAKKGFLDVLVDPSLDLSQVLVRTNVPNLSVLPSGQSHDNATEILSGPGMASLIGDLATRYSDRVIIVNAPPLLASSEAAALAHHAGQIVMVVEADKTSRAEISLALEQLESTENVNFLLNKVTDRRVTDRYGAYSYYGRK